MIVQANQLDWWMSDFGIDPNRLGCVMLNVEDPWHNAAAWQELKENEYRSPNLSYVKGLLDHWHATVRYGFLPEVKQSHIEHILSQIEKPDYVLLDEIEVWESVNGEPYECVVAKVNTLQTELSEAWQSFGVLPNIATFPYKPHVTLGYFKPGTWDSAKYEAAIDDAVATTDWKISVK